MRILVAIADFGSKGRPYLDQLVSTYQAMKKYTADIIVLSNIPKDIGKNVEVRVGLPITDPWSLPFAHQQVFADRVDQYDLFIYSENDMLVEERNIDAFLEMTQILPQNEIAGFLQSEKGPDSQFSYCGVHSHFRWDAKSMRTRGSHKFATFTNEHAACYIVTRGQLKRAIASGGFHVPPHKGRHDLLCTAATDVYTQCGMTKLICLTRFDDFVLPHLPNKYIGLVGISRSEMFRQIDKLCSLNGAPAWTGPLVDVETKLPMLRWSKNLFDKPDAAILESVPDSASSVLVIGCGWGATESQLMRGGREVVAIPIDPVLGSLAQHRGVPIVECGLEDLPTRLQRQFDCLVLPEVLHLMPNPEEWLRSVSALLAPGGTAVATVPYVGEFRAWVLKRKRRLDFARFDAVGVQVTSKRRLRRWMKSANLRAVDLRVNYMEGREKYAKFPLRLMDWATASRLTITACKPH